MYTVIKGTALKDFAFLNEPFFELWREASNTANRFFNQPNIDLHANGQRQFLLEQLNLTEDEFQEIYIQPFSTIHEGLLPLIAKAITVDCGGTFDMRIQKPPGTKALQWTRAQLITLKGRLPGFDPVPYVRSDPAYFSDWNPSCIMPFKQCLYCGEFNPKFRENKKDLVWFCHNDACVHGVNSHAWNCHMEAWRNEKQKITKLLKRRKSQEDAIQAFTEIFNDNLKTNSSKPAMITELDLAKSSRYD